MNTITKTVKDAFFINRWVIKKYISLIERTLDSDERLLGVGIKYDKPDEQLYVTDKRVIIKKINTMSGKEITIPLANISAVRIKNKFIHCDIDLRYSGTSIEVEGISADIAYDLQKLISMLIMRKAR